MARPTRNFKTGDSNHTASRCINCQNYFLDKYYRTVVCVVIMYALDKYEFELNAFVLMPNHFHLVITTLNDEHSLSKIMQLIKSMIAKRMNKLLGRIGPFWNERFVARYVYYFPTLCTYFANNPVKWRLVNHPFEWEYGSYDVYRKKNAKCMVKITLHKHFLALGDTLEECYKRQLEIDELYAA